MFEEFYDLLVGHESYVHWLDTTTQSLIFTTNFMSNKKNVYAPHNPSSIW